MSYRAGTRGLAFLGLPDREPAWLCSCGEWEMTAVSKPNRRTGNNKIEADRAWTAHLTSVRQQGPVDA